MLGVMYGDIDVNVNVTSRACSHGQRASQDSETGRWLLTDEHVLRDIVCLFVCLFIYIYIYIYAYIIQYIYTYIMYAYIYIYILASLRFVFCDL